MNLKIRTSLLFVCGLLLSTFAATTSLAASFEKAVLELDARSYSAKRKAIERIQEIDDPRLLPTLRAMKEGLLHFDKSRNAIVVYSEEKTPDEAYDVVTKETYPIENARSLDKVKINNNVRSTLSTAIASIQLSSKNRNNRLLAARELIQDPDEDLRDLIVDAIRKEESTSVKEEMQVALARIDIESNDELLQERAVNNLSKSVSSGAVTALTRLAKRDEDGNFIADNKELAAIAEKRLEAVKSRIKVYEFTKDLFFGISLGSVLLLAAVGLAITFGVMGVINMAHGEMIMLGAYTTFAVQQIFPELIGISVLIAIPAAFLVSGAVGILIERVVIRHLYGRPLDTLLATFGISLILQQLVRTYRSNNVPVEAPDWLTGSLIVNGALDFTFNRLYIILFSVIVLVALAVLLQKTITGLQIRAVTQNRPMANSMGIRSSWVDALTFGLGSGIAGIAGVALSQITNVGPNMGQDYIIDSFMVVVFGGVGNLLGTMFAAVSLGVINKFLEPTFGAVVGKIIVLVFIILFIQWRPRGLFALKGRFVED